MVSLLLTPAVWVNQDREGEGTRKNSNQTSDDASSSGPASPTARCVPHVMCVIDSLVVDFLSRCSDLSFHILQPSK